MVETFKKPLPNDWAWKFMKDIPDEDDKFMFIKTGIKRLDELTGGLILGGTSIWSGTNGSSKSTIIGQIGLNIVNSKQCKVAYFSGELPDKRFKRWLYLQASGKKHNNQKKNDKGELTNFFETPLHLKSKITAWFAENLYLYDNKKGFKIEQVGNQIAKLLEYDSEVKVVFIDNLFVLDIGKLSEQKWEAQRQLILKMCQLAKSKNVHISFVAHPTKIKTLVRKEDVSGSSDLTNAVDNVFIMHRNTTDFKVRSKEYFGWSDSHEIYKFDNIIEIVKDRELGAVENLIGLYFELESKRLLNNKEEQIVYSWETMEKQGSLIELVPIDEDLFDIF